MNAQYFVIAGLFLLGVFLAMPLAICLCAAAGAALTGIDRLTTRCPKCGQKQMRSPKAICETYPTGRGTGKFYLCDACSARWFWSNDDRGWLDASDAKFDWAFNPGGQRGSGVADDMASPAPDTQAK